MNSQISPKQDTTLSPKNKMDDFKSKKRKGQIKNDPTKEKRIKTSSDASPSNKSIESFQKRLAKYVGKFFFFFFFVGGGIQNVL